MCINWFKNVKCPKPDIKEYISSNDLKDVLEDVFGNIPILIPDHHYQLATKESFEKFLKYDTTNNYLYTGDKETGGFDCDDYSARLYGNTSIPKWANVPIGIVWLSDPAHAVNVFVDENKEVWYIEPQNDKMFKVKDAPNWIPYITWI